MKSRTSSRRHRALVAVVFAIGLLLSLSAAVAVPPPPGYDTGRILDAIRQTETGGEADPANAVGDGGKAIGPFQIHKAYWQDAVAHDPSIGGTYQDCRDEAYARRIVLAYLSRYCTVWTDETVARIHNGGPKGHRKAATLPYWRKVKAALR